MRPPRPHRAPSRQFLPSTTDAGFLPDLEAIGESLLERTVALYLCSPSNPQGAVAGRAYLARAIALARRFDFLLFADECYSEIYGDIPPPGALETAYAETGSLANVVAFNSLSKRSGLPGLRSGFVAGDPEFIAAFGRFPQRRLPASAAAGAACLGRRLGRRSAMSRRAARSTARISTIADDPAWGPLRLPAAGRKLLSLAEYGGFRGWRGGRENPLERVWCQSAAGGLSRTSRTRWRSIRVRTMSGSRSCMTRTQRARP